MQNTEGTLTIQEASRRAGVTTHTLRFWEKELDGIISPLRTRGGQRRYTVENLLMIERVKRLKKQGLSLGAIKARLDLGADGTGKGIPNPNQAMADLLADRVAEIVRSAVHKFFDTEMRESNPEKLV